MKKSDVRCMFLAFLKLLEIRAPLVLDTYYNASLVCTFLDLLEYLHPLAHPMKHAQCSSCFVNSSRDQVHDSDSLFYIPRRAPTRLVDTEDVLRTQVIIIDRRTCEDPQCSDADDPVITFSGQKRKGQQRAADDADVAYKRSIFVNRVQGVCVGSVYVNNKPERLVLMCLIPSWIVKVFYMFFFGFTPYHINSWLDTNIHKTSGAEQLSKVLTDMNEDMVQGRASASLSDEDIAYFTEGMPLFFSKYLRHVNTYVDRGYIIVNDMEPLRERVFSNPSIFSKLPYFMRQLTRSIVTDIQPSYIRFFATHFVTRDSEALLTGTPPLGPIGKCMLACGINTDAFSFYERSLVTVAKDFKRHVGKRAVTLFNKKFAANLVIYAICCQVVRENAQGLIPQCESNRCFSCNAEKMLFWNVISSIFRAHTLLRYPEPSAASANDSEGAAGESAESSELHRRPIELRVQPLNSRNAVLSGANKEPIETMRKFVDAKIEYLTTLALQKLATDSLWSAPATDAALVALSQATLRFHTNIVKQDRELRGRYAFGYPVDAIEQELSKHFAMTRHYGDNFNRHLRNLTKPRSVIDDMKTMYLSHVSPIGAYFSLLDFVVHRKVPPQIFDLNRDAYITDAAFIMDRTARDSEVVTEFSKLYEKLIKYECDISPEKGPPRSSFMFYDKPRWTTVMRALLPKLVVESGYEFYSKPVYALIAGAFVREWQTLYGAEPSPWNWISRRIETVHDSGDVGYFAVSNASAALANIMRTHVKDTGAPGSRINQQAALLFMSRFLDRSASVSFFNMFYTDSDASISSRSILQSLFTDRMFRAVQEDSAQTPKKWRQVVRALNNAPNILRSFNFLNENARGHAESTPAYVELEAASAFVLQTRDVFTHLEQHLNARAREGFTGADEVLDLACRFYLHHALWKYIQLAVNKDWRWHKVIEKNAVVLPRSIKDMLSGPLAKEAEPRKFKDMQKRRERAAQKELQRGSHPVLLAEKARLGGLRTHCFGDVSAEETKTSLEKYATQRTVDYVVARCEFTRMAIEHGLDPAFLLLDLCLFGEQLHLGVDVECYRVIARGIMTRRMRRPPAARGKIGDTYLGMRGAQEESGIAVPDTPENNLAQLVALFEESNLKLSNVKEVSHEALFEFGKARMQDTGVYYTAHAVCLAGEPDVCLSGDKRGCPACLNQETEQQVLGNMFFSVESPYISTYADLPLDKSIRSEEKCHDAFHTAPLCGMPSDILTMLVCSPCAPLLSQQVVDSALENTECNDEEKYASTNTGATMPVEYQDTDDVSDDAWAYRKQDSDSEDDSDNSDSDSEAAT